MEYFWRHTVYSHSSQCGDSFESFTVFDFPQKTHSKFFFKFQNEYSHCIKISLALLSSTSHHSEVQLISPNIAGKKTQKKNKQKTLNNLSSCLN